MSKKNISKMPKNMAHNNDYAEHGNKDRSYNDRFFTTDADILWGAQGRLGDWIDPRYYLDCKAGQIISEDELSTANMPKNPISKSFWS